MLRPRMSSSGRGTVVLALGGVQPPDAPLVWRQPGAMCLGGDRRSPGLVPAGGAVFSLVRVTTNPQPPPN